MIGKNFLNKQFLKFLIIGTLNTLNASVWAFVYSRLLQANLAFVAGYITALIIGYFLNSFFVFNTKPSFVKFLKFALSYVPNFIIQNFAVIAVYNILHWHELIAFVLAAVVGVPVTFLILKNFAFRQNKQQ